MRHVWFLWKAPEGLTMVEANGCTGNATKNSIIRYDLLYHNGILCFLEPNMSQFYHIGGVFPGRHWSSLLVIGCHWQSSVFRLLYPFVPYCKRNTPTPWLFKLLLFSFIRPKVFSICISISNSTFSCIHCSCMSVGVGHLAEVSAGLLRKCANHINDMIVQFQIIILATLLFQTIDQFEFDGCDNCDEYLHMKNNRDAVYDCTSSSFDG